MKAYIKCIDYYLPSRRLTNKELSELYPDWSADKIQAKTGIVSRAISARSECASDLAVLAAERMFSQGIVSRSEVDFLIFCTQSPDYFLPTTACLIQTRLGISSRCGAIDVNLGCSGYVYCLSMAKAMIETGQSKNVLLLVGDTYSKYIRDNDRSVRSIFGDGAAATVVSGKPGDFDFLGPFIFGTDGSGASNLIVANGAMRCPKQTVPQDIKADQLETIQGNYLYMNGPQIFDFTLRVVPEMCSSLLQNAGLSSDDVDHFVFHQANKFMIEHLRLKVGLHASKVAIEMAEHGNTVSASIPIVICEMLKSKKIKPGHTLALLGFGVGYSWAGGCVRWV
jgi:3-oxoacyl-[acyl-carrier-protein] synthase-3